MDFLEVGDVPSSDFVSTRGFNHISSSRCTLEGFRVEWQGVLGFLWLAHKDCVSWLEVGWFSMKKSVCAHFHLQLLLRISFSHEVVMMVCMYGRLELG